MPNRVRSGRLMGSIVLAVAVLGASDFLGSLLASRAALRTTSPGMEIGDAEKGSSLSILQNALTGIKSKTREKNTSDWKK